MSSVISRKFGTDLSNLPSQNTSGLKKQISTEIPPVSRSEVVPEILSEKQTAPQPVCSLDDELLAEINSFEVLKDEENKISSVSPSEEEIEIQGVESSHTQIEPVVDLSSSTDRSFGHAFKYDRDFMLTFQSMCTQKIDGLLPEVCRGYVDPNAAAMRSAKMQYHMSQLLSKPRTNHGSLSRQAVSTVATPPRANIRSKLNANAPSMDLGSFVPVASVAQRPLREVSSANTTPRNKSKISAFGGANKENIDPIKMSELIEKMMSSAPSSPTAARSSGNKDDASLVFAAAEETRSLSPALDANAIKMEWRPKPVQNVQKKHTLSARKEKPRETDAKRLAARQKQLDIGMNTAGYRRYLEVVPADKRAKEGPRMPDIHQVCSKRSWDGQVRKWRRELHQYDPSEQCDDVHAGGDEEFDDANEVDDEQSSEGEVILAEAEVTAC